MSNRNIVAGHHWFALLEAAIVESDPTRMACLLSAAQKAVRRRKQELSPEKPGEVANASVWTKHLAI